MRHTLPKCLFALSILCLNLFFSGVKCYGQCSSIDFNAGTTRGCAVLQVIYQATGAPPGTTYDWNLGNGFLTGKKDTITGVYTKAGQYTISMKANLKNGTSCLVKKDTLITVLPAVLPVVKAYPGFNLCDADRNILLIDSTTDTKSREWVIDGKSYYSNKISYKFASTGTKPLSLKVTNQYGCVNYFTGNIIINDSIPVDFCADITVTDTLTSASFYPSTGDLAGRTIKSYIWSFPGGNPASYSGKNPYVEYRDKSRHLVSLSIITADGCTYTATRQNFIGAFVSPVYNKICKNAPLVLGLDTTNKGIDSISWNLPGSSSKVSLDPRHESVTYDSAGNYALSASLSYKGNPGSPHCKVHIYYPTYVTIKGPTAGFRSTDRYSCNPKDTVHLINLTQTLDAPNVKYTWLFLDSLGQLLKTNGKIGPTSNYDTIYVPGKYGGISVAMLTTSTNGCRDSIMAENFIYVNKPKIDFTATPQNMCYGDYTKLTAITYPADPNPSIFTYDWNIQSATDTTFITKLQGSTASPWNGLHYPPDVYNVILTLNKNSRCPVTLTKKKFLNISGDDTYFSISKTSGCPGTVTRVAVGTQIINPAGAKVKYQWKVDPPANVLIDSVSSSASNIKFQDKGQYSITLVTTTLYGKDSCVSTYTQHNAVSVGINLKINLGGQKCLGDTVTADASNRSVSHIKWVVQPANAVKILPSDTDYAVKLVFFKDGCYSVILSAEKNINGSLCSETVSSQICYHTPVSSFYTKTPVLYCAPSTARFVNTSSKNAKWLYWDFGDGTGLKTGFVDSVSHTYTNFIKSDYAVGLKAIDSLGCGVELLKKNTFHVTGPAPYYTVNADKGCDSLHVVFTDSSSNVRHFRFFNDDGAASDTMSLKPHTYYIQDPTLDSMVFHPVLQSKDDSACPAFYIRPITIYRSPVASFTEDKDVGCIPVTVGFKAKTQNVTGWKWDFNADGKTDDSLQLNPRYTFLKSGNYLPNITVYNGPVCVSRIKGPQISVAPFAKALFAPSLQSFCGKQEISFLNGSKNTTHLIFDYSDGSPIVSDTIPNHIYYYNPAKDKGDSVVFSPKLVALNFAGCGDTIKQKIVAYRMPIAGFKSSVIEGCSPMEVLFTDTSTNGASTAWDFDNDGYIDAYGKTVKHTYYAGIYTVKMLSYTKNMCLDSIVKVNLITVAESPKPNFKVSDTDICLNTSVQFTNTTYPVSGIKTWFWKFQDTASGSDSSFAYEPVHTYNTSGWHSITLTAINDKGCSVSVQKKALYVENINPPNNLTLCFVTVVDSNSVLVSWNKASSQRFKEYRLNRVVNGLPVTAGIVNQISDTSFLDIDPSMKTGSLSYCYSVQALNTCDLASFASFSHCTILLSGSAASGPKNSLAWTGYRGWGPDRYLIYRSHNAEAPVLIDSVKGNITQYSDSNLCAGVYNYYVEAVSDQHISGSGVVPYRSKSNKIQLMSLYDTIYPKVNLTYVSVWNNEAVEIGWDSVLLKNKSGFQMEKYLYVPDSNWRAMDTINVLPTSYLDHKADIHTNRYLYKIRTKDNCGFYSPASNIGETILLKAKAIDDNIYLSWNGYQAWPGGIKNYTLQIKEKDKGFKTIWSLTDTFYTDKTVYQNIDTAYCYRVIATENSNTVPHQSISNEACMALPSRIYIPNAFTPGNKDSLNDSWKISGISVFGNQAGNLKSINVKIFNRWGTLVYESSRIDEGWNGKFRNEYVPIGIYLYIINAEGLDGRTFHLTGDINLIK